MSIVISGIRSRICDVTIKWNITSSRFFRDNQTDNDIISLYYFNDYCSFQHIHINKKNNTPCFTNLFVYVIQFITFGFLTVSSLVVSAYESKLGTCSRELIWILNTIITFPHKLEKPAVLRNLLNPPLHSITASIPEHQPQF